MTLEQIVQLIGASPYLAFVAALFMVINAGREFMKSESGQHLLRNGFTVRMVHRLDDNEREFIKKQVDQVSADLDELARIAKLHLMNNPPSTSGPKANGLVHHHQQTQQDQ